jgi:hypothetical protein
VGHSSVPIDKPAAAFNEIRLAGNRGWSTLFDPVAYSGYGVRVRRRDMTKAASFANSAESVRGNTWHRGRDDNDGAMWACHRTGLLGI